MTEHECDRERARYSAAVCLAYRLTARASSWLVRRMLLPYPPILARAAAGEGGIPWSCPYIAFAAAAGPHSFLEAEAVMVARNMYI
jgi:hypothetical protein